MPDFLTRADTDLREAAQALIAANNCNYDRDVMRSLGLFDRLWKALESPRNVGKGSDHGQGASEASQRNLTQSSPNPAGSPESIPHPFVGIPAGELGMSLCEHCKLPERDFIHSLKFQHTAPETIRISLPALRAVVLSVIDDGDLGFEPEPQVRHLPWELWHPYEPTANDNRLRFCDEIERRLRQLPAGAEREK